jgi:hypothetical protein
MVKGTKETTMDNNKITMIDKRISQIKQKLCEIGDMRPGSLTMQYRDPENKKGGYYQISYTYKMKSRTEYVRPPFVKQVAKQVKSYKCFKNLMEEWIELALEKSKLLMVSND